MKDNNEIKITKPSSPNVAVKPLPSPGPVVAVYRVRWTGGGSL